MKKIAILILICLPAAFLFQPQSNYKPLFHFGPEKHWLNDPCAPAIDQNGLLHVFYQYSYKDYWNAPIVWSHSTSTDYLHFNNENVVLAPSKKSDNLSVFTGSGTLVEKSSNLRKWLNDSRIIGQNCNLDKADDEDVALMMYTGIQRELPNWNMPYSPGIESQNLVYTLDENWNEWCKVEDPVLALPPAEWNVTGFRDPFIFKDSNIDRLMKNITLMDSSKSYFYMLVGGGLKNFGGSVFMYYSENLVEWNPMTFPLFFSDNSTLFSESGRSGDEQYTLGFNWEVPNLINMDSFIDPVSLGGVDSNIDLNQSLYLLYFGTEGNAKYLRGHHMGVYFLGHLEMVDRGKVIDSFPFSPLNDASRALQFRVVSSGKLDHGLLYAVNKLTDLRTGGSANDNNVLLGWINEDWEVSDMEREKFAGSLGLFRKVRVGWARECKDCPQVPVLNSEPLPVYKKFIEDGMEHVSYSNISALQDHSVIGGLNFSNSTPPPLIPPDRHDENHTAIQVTYFPIKGVLSDRQLKVSVSMQTTISEDDLDAGALGITAGLVIHHSTVNAQGLCDPWQEYSVIYFVPASNKIFVSRWKSSKRETANNETYSIPIRGGKTVDQMTFMDIYIDNSVVEVFAHGSSLATKIYPVDWNRLDRESVCKDKTRLGLFISKPNGTLSNNGTLLQFNQVDVWFKGVIVNDNDMVNEMTDLLCYFLIPFCIFALLLLDRRRQSLWMIRKRSTEATRHQVDMKV